MRVVFERFTDRARRVVVLSQEEARLLNHNYIGTEHLLLGLLDEADGVAARVLDALGVTTEAVRPRIEAIVGEGSNSPSEHIPFTPRAKKVLEYALREALQLGHNYIGTEHILLGLIREGQGIAAQVLSELGIKLAAVRYHVVELLGPEGAGREPIEEFEPRSAGGQEVLVESLMGEVRRLRGDVDRLRAALRQAEAEPEPAEPGAQPVPRLPDPETAPDQTLLRCSFCGQRHDEVAKLIAGPGVYICDRCITLCQEILAEANPPSPADPSDPPGDPNGSP